MWKAEFERLLFSNDPTKIDAVKAAKLKYDNFPSYLYQYRSFNSKSLKLLKTDKIYLSDPNDFNDPYDCAIQLRNGYHISDEGMKIVLESDPKGFKEEFKLTRRQMDKLKKSDKIIRDLSRFMAKNGNYEHENHKDSPKEVRDLSKPKQIREISKSLEKDFRDHTVNFDKLKENLLVSCFSEDNKSILMWSHYAQEHKGFCVQYDFKSLGNTSHLTRNLFPIFYNSKLFMIDDYIYNTHEKFKSVFSSYMKGIDLKSIRGVEIQLPEGNMSSNNMYLFYASLIKFEGWEYEQEWRYVLPFEKEEKPVCIKVPKPVAIYLGAKSDKKNKNILLKIAKEKNIDVYQMEMDSSKFALEPKSIQ